MRFDGLLPIGARPEEEPGPDDVLPGPAQPLDRSDDPAEAVAGLLVRSQPTVRTAGAAVVPLMAIRWPRRAPRL